MGKNGAGFQPLNTASFNDCCQHLDVLPQAKAGLPNKRYDSTIDRKTELNDSRIWPASA